MEASVLDLRYRMKEVLKALDRGEEVQLTHRGRPKGSIRPKRAGGAGPRAAEHPFFGMTAPAGESVAETMERLRGGRTV
jgi:antitoxin (DNA-binding transcriptional repressor) of toxin-antitoxin stability system